MVLNAVDCNWRTKALLCSAFFSAGTCIFLRFWSGYRKSHCFQWETSNAFHIFPDIYFAQKCTCKKMWNPFDVFQSKKHVWLMCFWYGSYLGCFGIVKQTVWSMHVFHVQIILPFGSVFIVVSEPQFAFLPRVGIKKINFEWETSVRFHVFVHAHFCRKNVFGKTWKPFDVLSQNSTIFWTTASVDANFDVFAVQNKWFWKRSIFAIFLQRRLAVYL